VITGCLSDASANESYESRVEARKKLIEDLKVQWKLLWGERFDDKERAEGISVADYLLLRVERGTIIHATRDFKALSFREILELHMVENPDRFIQPEASVGGWNKFIKKEIISQSPRRRSKRVASYIAEKPDTRGLQQLKKSGRGWLHII
jgi:hypothetical protein